MSLQSVLARINEIQGGMATTAPTTPATPATPGTAPTSGSSTFSSQLQSAMTGAPTTGAGAAGPPAAGAPAAATGTAGASFRQASPGTYPHLSGDLDAKPELLQRLEALAAKKGMKFHINSGHRSIAEQQRLWDNRHSNPLPVAPPGKSRHQSGTAADVSIGGRPIQAVISAAELRAAGLNPLAGDAPHVELR
jgi:hypothetical protein